MAADEQRAALAATPTAPDTVAALVRAARALLHAADQLTFTVEPPHATDECIHWWAEKTEDAIEALDAILDAPPWRDLR